MMNRLILPLLLASTIAAHAQQPDWSGSYYCKVTASGGVKLNKSADRWEGIVFNVQDEAQLVVVKATGQQRESMLGKTNTYSIMVKDFGDADEGYPCLQYFDPDENHEFVSINAQGATSCQWVTWTYYFDFKSLRMQTMYRGGYMDATGANTDTPYVSVAKCDKVG